MSSYIFSLAYVHLSVFECGSSTSIPGLIWFHFLLDTFVISVKLNFTTVLMQLQFKSP